LQARSGVSLIYKLWEMVLEKHPKSDSTLSRLIALHLEIPEFTSFQPTISRIVAMLPMERWFMVWSSMLLCCTPSLSVLVQVRLMKMVHQSMVVFGKDLKNRSPTDSDWARVQFLLCTLVLCL